MVKCKITLERSGQTSYYPGETVKGWHNSVIFKVIVVKSFVFQELLKLLSNSQKNFEVGQEKNSEI